MCEETSSATLAEMVTQGFGSGMGKSSKGYPWAPTQGTLSTGKGLSLPPPALTPPPSSSTRLWVHRNVSQQQGHTEPLRNKWCGLSLRAHQIWEHTMWANTLALQQMPNPQTINIFKIDWGRFLGLLHTVAAWPRKAGDTHQGEEEGRLLFSHPTAHAGVRHSAWPAREEKKAGLLLWILHCHITGLSAFTEAAPLRKAVICAWMLSARFNAVMGEAAALFQTAKRWNTAQWLLLCWKDKRCCMKDTTSRLLCLTKTTAPPQDGKLWQAHFNTCLRCHRDGYIHQSVKQANTLGARTNCHLSIVFSEVWMAFSV